MTKYQYYSINIYSHQKLLSLVVLLPENLCFKFSLEQIPFAIVLSDSLDLDHLSHRPVEVSEFILGHALVEDLLD